MTAFESVRAVYEKLGAEEPFWAVLSHSEYRRDVVDEEAFFATGVREIARQMELVRRFHVNLNHGRALDFGCGVGRLTNALGDYFDEVVGVDVSSTMIDNAQRLRRNADCSFLCNTREDLSIFPDRHFDFVYSDITLQHIPMPAAGRYLAEFVRVLKEDGLIICLVPDTKYLTEGTWSAGWDKLYRERLRPWLKSIRGKQPVQIHAIARQRVEEILAVAGGRILRTEVTPDFVNKNRPYKPLFYWIQRGDRAALPAHAA